MSAAAAGAGRRRELLTGISGVAGPDLFAILGPSGCGKTTLIDILSGRKTAGSVSGHVTVNGVAMDSASRKAATGYVMQDDVLMPTATVREYLDFHARLRLGTQLTEAERAERVERVIKDLGLEKSTHSHIGDQYRRGLSGGEKRRVTIACELLASNSVLFLDEPTSGLDSASAENVMDALEVIVHQGRCTMFSIHQPPSALFHQFDRILLLSKNGEPLYCGPRDRVLDHFEQLGYRCPPDFNPTEFLLDLSTKLPENEVRTLIKAFPSSAVASAEKQIADRIKFCASEPGSEAQAAEAARSQAAPWCTQFSTVARRSLLNIIRHPLLITVNLLASVAVAMIVGTFFWQVRKDMPGALNRAGLFFFTLIFFLLLSLVQLGLWHDERLLYLRESQAGCYSPGSFLLAKIVCDVVPLRVIPTTFYAAIVYNMAGLNDDVERCASNLAILVLANLVGSALMLCVGIACQSSAMSIFCGALISLFSLLFSGYMVQPGTSPSALGWVRDLSFLNYAFDALMQNEMDGLHFLMQPKGEHYHHLKFTMSGQQVLDQLGIGSRMVQTDIFVLMGLLVGFFAASYLLLRVCVREIR